MPPTPGFDYQGGPGEPPKGGPDWKKVGYIAGATLAAIQVYKEVVDAVSSFIQDVWNKIQITPTTSQDNNQDQPNSGALPLEHQ